MGLDCILGTMEELIQNQFQLVKDLQEECLEGKRSEDSLKQAIDGLDNLYRLQQLIDLAKNRGQYTVSESTFGGLGK